MSAAMTFCLDCQAPAQCVAGRCPECRRAHNRAQSKGKPRTRANRPDRQGPRAAEWRRLRAKAAHQDFCITCGRTSSQLGEHERLELDHEPSAWLAYEENRPLTINDVSRKCSKCNRNAGSAQVGSERYEEWLASVNT